MLSAGINVLDGEDQRLAITVGKGTFGDWKSVIFPWCSSTEEVQKKAFRFTNIRTGHVFMYMFQDYETSQVCWAVDLKEPWTHRKVVRTGLEGGKPDDIQGPLSALDIYVMPDRVCGLAATSENDTFKVILEEAMAVATEIGQLGEIGGALGGDA